VSLPWPSVKPKERIFHVELPCLTKNTECAKWCSDASIGALHISGEGFARKDSYCYLKSRVKVPSALRQPRPSRPALGAGIHVLTALLFLLTYDSYRYLIPVLRSPSQGWGKRSDANSRSRVSGIDRK
jgi:hypothetical protein